MTIVTRGILGVLLAGGLATAAAAQTKWDLPTPYPDGIVARISEEIIAKVKV